MEYMKKNKIAIIGGGAAGMMCAIAAAEDKAGVVIFEKNEKLGKKLFITGKGRCNITNDASHDEFLDSVMRGSKFLLSSFKRFDNGAIMNFLRSQGVALKVERGERVFPKSDKAGEIIDAFRRALDRLSVTVLLNSPVDSIVTLGDEFIINGSHNFDKIIIATGGVTYSSTGSTGDGHRFAEKLSHKITPLFPALSGLRTKNLSLVDLQGLSLINIRLKAKLNKKIVFDEIGEMIFTHFGISGPLTLTLSSHLKPDLIRDYHVWIDLKPALSEEQLINRINRDFSNEPKRSVKNILRRLLPAGIIDVFLNKCDIDGNYVCNQLDKQGRRKLAKNLKQFIIDIDGFYDMDKAIITRGGISLKDINPATMESRLVKGLYFAGEVLDIDALTGGYNLQIALSTGYCAGTNAKQ